MTDEPNVLDYLREQFARLHQRMDKADARQDEMITRIGSVERNLAGMAVDVAGIRRALGMGPGRRPAGGERGISVSSVEAHEKAVGGAV